MVVKRMCKQDLDCVELIADIILLARSEAKKLHGELFPSLKICSYDSKVAYDCSYLLLQILCILSLAFFFCLQFLRIARFLSFVKMFRWCMTNIFMYYNRTYSIVLAS